MENTFNTLEEIQATFGTSLFGDNQIKLRSEQRESPSTRQKHNSASAAEARPPAIIWKVQPKYSQYLWNA